MVVTFPRIPQVFESAGCRIEFIGVTFNYHFKAFTVFVKCAVPHGVKVISAQLVRKSECVASAVTSGVLIIDLDDAVKGLVDVSNQVDEDP